MKPLVDIYELYSECRAALNETNDCTVTSLAFLMGWSYRYTANWMRVNAGRHHRQPVSMYIASHEVPGALDVNGLCPDKGVTLAEFCRTHPLGRYWVNVTGHALAVVNGQVHDHSLRPRRRVRYAWRIHSQPQLRLGHEN